ncbi:MAG TPA: glycosyltransferase [Acidimicrobiales bacterium]|nr:glycosyltransferase [Acidimicrobiales bacterium]
MIQREAEALAAAGFDAEVICMRDAERPRQTVVNGVRITSLPSSRQKGSKFRYLFDYVRFFLLVTGTLAVRQLRRPYAVVQVNTMPDFLVFAAVIPKRLGARVIAYMHEPSPELAETVFGAGRLVRLLERVEQRALRFADHSVAVTEELKQRFVERGAQPDRITVVLNCVAPENIFEGWSPPPHRSRPGVTLVCHGSIEERYGQDTIVEAARLLRPLLPDLRVVFTGRGSGVDQLLKLIDSFGLRDFVRYEGWVSRTRLNDILHSADVGIVAQKASPYSHLVHTNKMVDYWIFGLPVIASRLQAISRMYDDRVIEYYEAGDAAALACAVLRLHDDPERRAELARNGRLAHLQHGWAVERLKYLGVYEALLDGTATSPAVSDIHW